MTKLEKAIKALSVMWPSLVVAKVEGRDTFLVDDRFVHFFVWDNGGEVGIEKVNAGNPAFTPLEICTGPDPNAVTVALRIKALMDGEAIDYSDMTNVFSDEEEAAILASGR